VLPKIRNVTTDFWFGFLFELLLSHWGRNKQQSYLPKENKELEDSVSFGEITCIVKMDHWYIFVSSDYDYCKKLLKIS